MKKLFKKYTVFILIFVFAIIPYSASAADYYIDSYDINITVNENNTLDITEKIGTFFRVKKHGIYRKIPLKNEVVRLDGTTSNNRAKISNISVSDNYTLSTENGYRVIKIGDDDITLTGPKSYTISYTYNLGKDTGKDYDELYFNLIGDEWDTTISKVTFTITMPKEFDESKLGFSSGEVGTTDSSYVSYKINGNVITGRLNKTLKAGEALTVRLELPEGYFVGASNNLDLMMILSIVLPILFVFITLVLWYKYGKDNLVVETVEFYPPEGFNSAEIGFLYKGRVDDNDITSLLIYLANKGYIKIYDGNIDFNSKKIDLQEGTLERANEKIIELEKKIQAERINNPDSSKIKVWENLLSVYKNIDNPVDYQLSDLEKKKINSINKDFVIEKIKDYDGNNINEQYFFDGLFEYDRTQVTEKQLYNKFYTTLDAIRRNINSKTNKQKIFEKTASDKTIFLVLMMIITYCLITIPPILNYGNQEFLIFSLLFPAIGFIVMFSMLFGGPKTIYVNGKATRSLIVTKLFGFFWGGMFGGIPWVFMVLPSLIIDPVYLVIYIIGFICILVMFLLFKIMPRRTAYGNQILGKIRGFKKFLETAEKTRLEAMVMQNPSYFYDILPYTYVLGISDKWIKKFESIALRAPDWYDGNSSFDTTSFGNFIDSTMTSASSAMSSSPSTSGSGTSSGSSSGGGSSGGGSSGGGSGGGGGGSW